MSSPPSATRGRSRPWREDIVTYLLKQEMWSERNSRCWRTALKQHSFLGKVPKTDNGSTSVTIASRFLVSKNIWPLLGNGSVNRFPRKWLAYENERCCLRRPCRRIIRKATGGTKSLQLCMGVWRRESVRQEQIHLISTAFISRPIPYEFLIQLLFICYVCMRLILLESS
jgi:hypothetical protein